jgi:hypothetical protein
MLTRLCEQVLTPIMGLLADYISINASYFGALLGTARAPVVV